jgi:hypothetical protein
MITALLSVNHPSAGGTWGPDDYDVIQDGPGHWAHLQGADRRPARVSVDVDDHRRDRCAKAAEPRFRGEFRGSQGEVRRDMARVAGARSIRLTALVGGVEFRATADSELFQ